VEQAGKSSAGQRFAAIGFGMVAAFGMALVAEGALRSQGYEPAYRVETIGGWRLMPGLSKRRMRGNIDPHDFVLSTNGDGLRTDLSKEQKHGVRIAVMGDSTVFSWGVDEGETFAEALAAGLRNVRPKGAPAPQILNAAQPGHSSTQAAELFEDAVGLYQPDLTVLFLPQHDQNLVLVSDREVLDGAKGPTAALRVTLAQKSMLYSWLRLRLFPHADALWVFPGQEHSEPRVPRVSDRERSENLDRIRTTASAWGGDVILGLFPLYPDLQQKRGEPPLPRAGEDWLQNEGKKDPRILDLRGCCGPDADSLVFPYDHGHLNAKGSKVAGLAAAEELRALLWGE
jgi:hypothetical protein